MLDMTRFALVCLLMLGVSAPAAATSYLQAEPQEFPRESAQRLKIKFPVGTCVLEGDDGTTVRVLTREAQAETGVGDAAIQTDEGSVRDRGFIGHSAHWGEGKGSASIHVHVGVGDVRIDLR